MQLTLTVLNDSERAPLIVTLVGTLGVASRLKLLRCNDLAVLARFQLNALRNNKVLSEMAVSRVEMAGDMVGF
jgi:hypothetical protein